MNLILKLLVLFVLKTQFLIDINDTLFNNHIQIKSKVFLDDNNDEFYEIGEESTINYDFTNNFSFQNIWVINSYIILFTVLAGIFSRYKKLIKFRSLFLILSLIYLGFYNGGCPCMISSFQNLIIFISGKNASFETLFWIIILIPLTYLLGKSWCGWVCHFGALQEFLYNKKYGKLFLSENSQKVYRYLRIFFTIILIIQVSLTSDLFWCRIDPFKSIFNLHIGEYLKLLNIILIALVIIFSVFSYRPFCRGFCPVGLLLALISYIPYASILTLKESKCNNCSICKKECGVVAIKCGNNVARINNLDCIGCSECIHSCKNYGISYNRPLKKF